MGHSHRRSQEDPAGGHAPQKFLADLVILRFEKRRPKQKYRCSPKIILTPKYFGLATPLDTVTSIKMPAFFMQR